MKKFIYAVVAVVLASPAIALAADASTNGYTPTDGILGIFSLINTILGILVPLFISFGLLYFLWGVIKYIRSGGDPEKEKEARGAMIYGIIGIFVMVSVWGFVQILQSTFGFDSTTNTAPTSPELPPANS